MGLYFMLSTILIWNDPQSIIIPLSIIVGLILATIRTWLISNFQKRIGFFKSWRHYWKNLIVCLIGLQVFLILSVVSSNLTLAQAWNPQLIGIIIFMIPWIIYIDVFTDLGEAVFYFERRIADPFNLIISVKAQKNLKPT